MMYAYKKDGEVCFHSKKLSTGKFVELSDEEHRQIIKKMNSDGSYKLSIEKGKIIISDFVKKITLEDIQLKTSGILRRTEKYITVPDYRIDGVQINEDKKNEILSYRAMIWDIADFSGDPEKVQWPERPPWLN